MADIPAPRVFWVPKHGASRAEYEDALAWSQKRGRFAVADGASASAFARRWAQLLVHAYVDGDLAANSLEEDLRPLQERWSSSVDARALPWYAVEQVRRGAFAALAGLSVQPDGEWSALAVGDSCIFHVRDGGVVSAVPLSDADAFDNRPLLLGSRAAANIALREAGAIVTANGTWLPGDTFLLMSDALAASFLRHSEQTPDDALNALAFDASAAGFRQWIGEMRAERRLRNDDVSLLWLALPADAAA